MTTDNFKPPERRHQPADWKKLAKQRWYRIADLLIENERLRVEVERLRAELTTMQFGL